MIPQLSSLFFFVFISSFCSSSFVTMLFFLFLLIFFFLHILLMFLLISSTFYSSTLFDVYQSCYYCLSCSPSFCLFFSSSCLCFALLILHFFLHYLFYFLDSILVNYFRVFLHFLLFFSMFFSIVSSSFLFLFFYYYLLTLALCNLGAPTPKSGADQKPLEKQWFWANMPRTKCTVFRRWFAVEVRDSFYVIKTVRSDFLRGLKRPPTLKNCKCWPQACPGSRRCIFFFQ